MKALCELTTSRSVLASSLPLHILLRALALHMLMCAYTHNETQLSQKCLWRTFRNHILNGYLSDFILLGLSATSHIADCTLLLATFSSLSCQCLLLVFSLSISVLLPFQYLLMSLPPLSTSFMLFFLGVSGWPLFSLHTLFFSFIIFCSHGFHHHLCLGLKSLPWTHVNLPTGHVHGPLSSIHSELNSSFLPDTPALPYTQLSQTPYTFPVTHHSFAHSPHSIFIV